MSELSGADRLLLSALSADGAEAIAAALAAHDPAADCPTCGVGGGSHAVGCPRTPAPAAGEQPAGSALIRALLASGGFVPETRAELLRIAEVLEIDEAMESLAPAEAPDPERAISGLSERLEEVRSMCQSVVDGEQQSLKTAERIGSTAGFGWGRGEHNLAKRVLATLAQEVPR